MCGETLTKAFTPTNQNEHKQSYKPNQRQMHEPLAKRGKTRAHKFESQ